MEALKAVQLIDKFGECKACGSIYVGNGKGGLVIEDNYFKRSCKCGWVVVITHGNMKEELKNEIGM